MFWTSLASDVALIKLINFITTKLIIVVLHSNNTTSTSGFMMMFLFYHNYHSYSYVESSILTHQSKFLCRFEKKKKNFMILFPYNYVWYLPSFVQPTILVKIGPLWPSNHKIELINYRLNSSGLDSLTDYPISLSLTGKNIEIIRPDVIIGIETPTSSFCIFEFMIALSFRLSTKKKFNWFKLKIKRVKEPKFKLCQRKKVLT